MKGAFFMGRISKKYIKEWVKEHYDYVENMVLYGMEEGDDVWLYDEGIISKKDFIAIHDYQDDNTYQRVLGMLREVIEGVEKEHWAEYNNLSLKYKAIASEFDAYVESKGDSADDWRDENIVEYVNTLENYISQKRVFEERYRYPKAQW